VPDVTELDRRSFLKTSAAVAGGAAIAGPFAGYVAAPAVARPGRRPVTLVDVPDHRDDVVRLALPDGFNYRSFQPSSRTSPLTLDDGSKLPGRHDGMAAFASDHANTVTLVRNHEENGNGVNNAFGLGVAPVYDTGARGGTSTVRVSRQGDVAHSFASLGGTQMNCSGGKMPWGSWVTCEETVNGPDVGADFTGAANTNLTKRHGYIFEVPADGDATAQPIRSAGRFAHEAVAFDPSGGSLYLTEDNFDFPSGFYRYDPPNDAMADARLADGGTLWMLRVKEQPNKDLSGHFANHTTFPVDWVQIPNPDFGADSGPVLRTNNQAIVMVGDQGRANGAAGFSRLEGAVYEGGWIFWTSTQGGAQVAPAAPAGYGDGAGQIWGLDIASQTLHMLYESPSPNILDFPDNVTSSPRGTLIVCEDGGNFNFLRGLTREGRLFDIAQNKIAGQINDEFAGATFSPDGKTLFVNIQSGTGLSFAIWGPWHTIDV
jgi:secreted PhoX family phosphatase